MQSDGMANSHLQANGLRDVSPRLLWGGPGTGGDSLQAPNFLVAMLEHVATKGNATKLDYIQWHEKGYLATAGGKDSNTHIDVANANAVASAGVETSMPIGNEEVDPLGGWNRIEQWRGDAQYPAAAARILNMHQVAVREAFAGRANYAYHANDNAFLNYGDKWFDQRTLVARFEMNKTGTVRDVALAFSLPSCVAQLDAVGLADSAPTRWHSGCPFLFSCLFSMWAVATMGRRVHPAKFCAHLACRQIAPRAGGGDPKADHQSHGHAVIAGCSWLRLDFDPFPRISPA